MLARFYVILDDALLQRNSTLQALQNSFSADTVCVSSGNVFTLCDGVTNFGSIEHAASSLVFQYYDMARFLVRSNGRAGRKWLRNSGALRTVPQ